MLHEFQYSRWVGKEGQEWLFKMYFIIFVLGQCSYCKHLILYFLLAKTHLTQVACFPEDLYGEVQVFHVGTG